MSGQRCSLCDYELGDDYRTQCDGLCFDEASTCEERWRERQRAAPKPAADLGPVIDAMIREVSRRLSRRHWLRWSRNRPAIRRGRVSNNAHIRSLIAAVRVLRREREPSE